MAGHRRAVNTLRCEMYKIGSGQQANCHQDRFPQRGKKLRLRKKHVLLKVTKPEGDRAGI